MASRKKEIQYLQYSAEKVFKGEFKEEGARQIASDDEISEQVETFASHFCRLQCVQEKSGAFENK